MAIIERHVGCPVVEQFAGCWGPSGSYYTVFGTELRDLLPHLILSIILSLVLLGALLLLKKKGKAKMSVAAIIAICIGAIIMLFFALAYAVPVQVMY